jgi:hypothetical protein
MSTNDNEYTLPSATALSSDAPGHAALLLVESLIHGLCEKEVLTPREAVDIAERALNVQFEQAEAANEAGVAMWRSHALLSSIVTSLRVDDQTDRISSHVSV